MEQSQTSSDQNQSQIPLDANNAQANELLSPRSAFSKGAEELNLKYNDSLNEIRQLQALSSSLGPNNSLETLQNEPNTEGSEIWELEFQNFCQLNEILVKILKEVNNKINSINSHNERLNEDLASAKRDLDSSKRRIESLEAQSERQIMTPHTENTRLRLENRDLKKNVNSLKDELEKSEKQVASLREDIEHMVNTLDTCNEKIESANKSLADEKKRFIDLTGEKESLARINEDLTRKIVQLEGTENRLTEKISKIDEISTNFTNKIADLKADMLKMNNETNTKLDDKSNMKLCELNTELQRLRDEYSLKDREIDELKNDLNETKKELKESQQELRSKKLKYKNRTEQFERDIENLKIQRNQLHDEITNLTSQNAQNYTRSLTSQIRSENSEERLAEQNRADIGGLMLRGYQIESLAICF